METKPSVTIIRILGGAAVLAVAVSLLVMPAVGHAKGKVKTDVVATEVGGGPPTFDPATAAGCYNPKLDPQNTTLLKKRVLGFFQIKATKKPGEAGATFQLNLKNIDCGDASCPGSATQPKLSQCNETDHVMQLIVQTNITGAVDIHVAVGFDLVLGKSVFPDTGKNKVSAALAFGPLVTAGFNQPSYFRGLNVRGPGSVPLGGLGCTNAPTPLLGNEPCLDGELYGRAGTVQDVDETFTCTSTVECSLSQICSGGFCTPEPCTIDSDCDQDGGGAGGSGECGSNGQCCDPAIDPTCAGQV